MINQNFISYKNYTRWWSHFFVVAGYSALTIIDSRWTSYEISVFSHIVSPLMFIFLSSGWVSSADFHKNYINNYMWNESKIDHHHIKNDAFSTAGKCGVGHAFIFTFLWPMLWGFKENDVLYGMVTGLQISIFIGYRSYQCYYDYAYTSIENLPKANYYFLKNLSVAMLFVLLLETLQIVPVLWK